MNKFNIVGIFLFLPILCSKSRKVGVITASPQDKPQTPPAPGFKTISFLPAKEAKNRTDISKTESRYASHIQTDPGKLDTGYF